MSNDGSAYAFPTLIGGLDKTFAVIGTGLSYPDCPTADELKNRVPVAVRHLGLPEPSPAPADKAFNLYDWAERTLTSLKEQNPGQTEDALRWRLAEGLGLFDEPRWFGNVRVPLRGNTPRHRALARLVVEGRFSAFYCLNWDALVDRALESVGMKERRQQGDPAPGLPWNVTSYARVVRKKHQSRATNSDRIFPLYKPHGCVEELRAGGTHDVVFKITTNDLHRQPEDEQSFIEGRFSELAGGKPILGIGWKASEPYLQDAIKAIEPASVIDAFILASRSWHHEHHDPIAASRATDKLKAHAKAGGDDYPVTLDTLFPWLFARYALRILQKPAAPADRQKINQLCSELDNPENAGKRHPLVLWCDDWLPAWVRLCWQTGAMQGCDPDSQPIAPHDIPISPPDLHIPLSGPGPQRQDLMAAGRLLVSLNGLGSYDYTRFPGALWDELERHLILPLPTWGDLDYFNDLAGMKNLFSALRLHGLGVVRKISLLGLTPRRGIRPLDDRGHRKLAAVVAKRMPHFAHARSEQLGWINLDYFKRGVHEDLAPTVP